MNIAQLKVNDKVAVARMGNWENHSQGIYVVTKINKVRIHVKRETDGYEREFSANTGRELGKSDSKYRAAYLESVEYQNLRTAIRQHNLEVNGAWTALQEAASSKSIAEVNKALAKLKAVGIVIGG